MLGQCSRASALNSECEGEGEGACGKTDGGRGGCYCSRCVLMFLQETHSEKWSCKEVAIMCVYVCSSESDCPVRK